MSTPRYPALFQVNTRVRLSELSAAGAKGDARRHPRRGARPAGRGRVRPRLVPRRLADRRGGPARLAVEARVARRVPPRPPRLPRGRRHRLLLRRPGLPGPRGLRRRRGARPAARAPEASRPAPHPRLRPEPHGAGPPLGERAPGLLRVGDGGAARRAAPELLPRRQGPGRARPGVRARPLLRRLAGHAPAELRQPGPPARRCSASCGASRASATASAATWRCSSCRRSSSGPGGSPPPRSGRGRRRPSARKVPGFLFLAEVYWDLEWTLQQQGFDYTYDKRLYDRLEEGHARPVREHLFAGLDFQDHLARFLENHDEPRAAATFAPEVHRAAAILTFLTPGLRFFHQGQREGKRVRIPVHLGRGPDEAKDAGIAAFYDGLLECLKDPAFRDGDWQLLECRPAWEGNGTSDSFVAFSWTGAGERRLVAVNYADHRSQCYVTMPWRDLDGPTWRLAGPRRAVRLQPPGRRPHLAGPVPRHARVGLPRVRRLTCGVSHRC